MTGDRDGGRLQGGRQKPACLGSVSEEEQPEGDWRGVGRAGSVNPVSF